MTDHRRTVLKFLVDRESHLQGAPVQIVDSMEFVSPRGRRVICDLMDEPFQNAESAPGIKPNRSVLDAVWWRKNTDMVECVSVHPPYEILARFRSVHEAAAAAKCTVEHLSSWLPASLSASSSTPMENIGKLLHVSTQLSPFCGWKYATKTHLEQRLICYDNYFCTGRHLLYQSIPALVDAAKRASRALARDKKGRPTDIAPPLILAHVRIEPAPSKPKSIKAVAKSKKNTSPAKIKTAPPLHSVPVPEQETLPVQAPAALRDGEPSTANNSSALARSLGLDLAPHSENVANPDSLPTQPPRTATAPPIPIPPLRNRLIEARTAHGEEPFEVYARFTSPKAAEAASGVKSGTISASCVTAFQKNKPFHITTSNLHYGWAFVLVNSHSDLPLFDNYFVNGRAEQDIATKEPPPSALAAMRAKKGIKTLLATQAAQAVVEPGVDGTSETSPTLAPKIPYRSRRKPTEFFETTSDTLFDGEKPPNPYGVQLFYYGPLTDDPAIIPRKRLSNSSEQGPNKKKAAHVVHPSLQNAHYDEGVIIISPSVSGGLGHPSSARTLGLGGTLAGNELFELGLWDDKPQNETDDSDSDSE